MKKQLKKLLIGEGEKLYKVKFGIAAGLYYQLNPANKSQLIIGLYELEIQKYFKKYAKICNYIFDIGAAYGYYSLIYKKFNPSGQVFMFEPGYSKFNQVQLKNFKANNFDLSTITQINKMVSNTKSEKTIAIDDFFKEKNQKLLFKIDVDGYELDVLKSGIETFKNNNCYFVVETHSYQLEEDCLKFLENIGFKTKIIKNGAFRTIIKDERPIELNRWFIAQ